MSLGTASDPMLSITLRLCAVGIALQSLELLALRRELAPGGLLGWTSTGRGVRGKFAALIHGESGSACLLMLRFASAGAALLLPWGTPVTFGCVAVLFGLQLAYNRRFVIVAGNCETMFLIELFALLVAALPGAGSGVRLAAIGFLAANTSLAYLVAALNKAGSAPWRTGARLRQIARHGSYELPEFLIHVLRKRRVAMFVSWSVIGLELALPFVVFFPPTVFWLLLTAGLVFHASIAFLMGLHGFWWAFAGAYPALVAVHELVR